MHKYEIIIYWSNEDNTFIAKVPELPGCMAHGDTQVSALANANEAIQLWIDTANEFGDFIPKPKGRLVASDVAEPKSKRQKRSARLSFERKNNPRIFNLKTPQITANPNIN